MFLNASRHKQWRKLAKKLRRQRIRQLQAQERDRLESKEKQRRESSPTYTAWLEGQRQAEEFAEQEEQRQAAERETRWLQTEQEACKQWNELQKRLQFAREERARQNARIKEEWECEQKRLKDIKERNQREEEEKRKKQQELAEQVSRFIADGGEVPEGLNTTYETNPNKQLCPFFNKTGACRFRDACSRNHVRPGASQILLIPNFYSHYSLEQTETEHGSDSTLEFERHEIYDDFKEFFYDVVPELERCGTVTCFRVCCNHEPHLRGNVYVEYGNVREAMRGYQMFQGRWYGGKQLQVEFCKLHSWKAAICGLFFKKKCPKGSSCNFLHVFRNPGNLFSLPYQQIQRIQQNNGHSERRRESEAREWRWSESPERIVLDNNRRSRDRSRSRRQAKDSRTRMEVIEKRERSLEVRKRRERSWEVRDASERVKSSRELWSDRSDKKKRSRSSSRDKRHGSDKCDSSASRESSKFSSWSRRQQK